jgi:hypothetical protein
MATTGYHRIKALVQELGITIPDALALARQNDPFFAGAPAQCAKAEWFSELWTRAGYTTGVHLRRVHYRLLSEEGLVRHDGMPYTNTVESWGYLCDAGKAARYLGLVAVDAFVDHRNPPPVVMMSPPLDPSEPTVELNTSPRFQLPLIESDLRWMIDLTMPEPRVSGYTYDIADQPYLLELWIEKSTMDDVLLPVCRGLGINLVTSIGFQSITSVVSLIQRIRDLSKPTRIFYISDFDPAGDSMPVAVARQLEYWLQDADLPNRHDVKLMPLALTGEQVSAFALPRIPVKESDGRRAGFELAYGQGAVELDALEALHPGELAAMVRHAAAPYRDRNLTNKTIEMRLAAQNAAEQEWRAVTVDERRELRELDATARNIASRYEERLAALADELANDLAPLEERVEVVRHAVETAANLFEVDLPRVNANAAGDENTPGQANGWLFDAGRDYLDQLAVYKRRRSNAA